MIIAEENKGRNYFSIFGSVCEGKPHETGIFPHLTEQGVRMPLVISRSSSAVNPVQHDKSSVLTLSSSFVAGNDRCGSC